MKVILYMAITANGFIGRVNGNRDWVSESDTESFLDHIVKNKVVIMGRKTYEVNREFFPFENALNVVLTKNKDLLKQSNRELFTDKSPKVILKQLATLGFNTALLIGGRETNTAFLKQNLVDEIKLIVHPLLFGSGMEIVHTNNLDINLKLIENKTLTDGLVQLHYKVLK